MSVLREKVQEAAGAARELCAAGRYDSACGRAYYAMFNAARLLLSELANHDLERIRSHKAVLNLFSKEFVLTGRFDADLARRFRQSEQARAVADYDEMHVEIALAQDSVAAMELFLKRMNELLSEGKFE
jgi:uncharacterized protein (UPF0332 family)